MVNRKLQLQFLLILLAGICVLSFFIFKPFLTPLVLATVFSVVLDPLYRKISHKLGNKESVAALLTVLISVICLLVPLTLLGTQVFQESRQLYGSLADGNAGGNLIATAIQNTGHTVEKIFPGTEKFFVTASNNLDVYAKQGLRWLIDHLGSALSSISVLLLDLFIFIIALYYLLRDGRKLKESLVALSPLNDSDDEMIFGRLTKAVNSVITGNLMIALIQGFLTAVGLTLFGVPNSVLWGTIASIASLIPGFGTVLVIFPAILFLLFTGHALPALGLTVWGTLGVGLIDNLLGPRLIGRGMTLHPLFILLSVLGGVTFFGPVGIFLGPLSLSLLFAFLTIYTSLANQIMSVK